MRPNELMIDDWVKCGRRYMKVTQLAEDMDCDDIEPIILTPEILEKLGFSRTPIDYVSAKCYTLSADKYKLTLFIEDYGKYKRWLLNVESVDANCSNVKCNYLHLLQHTLRLCGISIEIEL
jgi:hypothetical protein